MRFFSLTQGWAEKLGPAFFILVYCSLAQAEPKGLTSALESARARHLDQDAQWYKLMHYDTRLFGGVKGDVVSPGFYLSPRGRTQPWDELEATLKGLYSGDLHEFDDIYSNTTKEKMAVQCQFPARTQFLIDRLKLDAKQFAKADCTRFEKYRDSIGAKSVFLVFSSFYLNNPSSAFGHSFLRFSKSSGGHLDADKNELLDTGISNAAELTTDNALLFAIGGLAGFFRGIYTKLPYYYKAREYNDFEARDLYSYELSLTQAEIDMLVAHLWELGSQFSRYYYLKQNCAYQILTAVEAAAPRYKILDQLKFYVIPSDTIREVYEIPGLVRRVAYRPSIRSVFFKRLEGLSSAELDAVESWGVDRKNPKNWAQFDKKAQVRILDAATDYIDFKYSKDVIVEKNENAAYRDELLRERAALGVRSEPLVVPENTDRSPHVGHRSSRPGVSFGREKSVGSFLQADIRFALTDLLDAPRGFPEHAQLGMMDVAFRWLVDSKNFEVEHLRFADINSLSPRERFVKNTSFKIDLKGTRFRDSNCERCFGGQVEGGLGLAWDVGPKTFPILFFTHAEVESAYAAFSGSNFRLGAGPGAGLLLGGERLRLIATWSARWLGFSRSSYYFKERLEARYSPSENTSLGVGAESVLQQWQGSLKAYFYF